MYCYHCGNKIYNGVKKCPYCDGEIDSMDNIIFENTLDDLLDSFGKVNGKYRFSIKIGSSYININGDKYFISCTHSFMKNITDKTVDELKHYIRFMSYKNLVEVGEKRIIKMIDKVIYAAIVFLKSMNVEVRYNDINSSDFTFYLDSEYIWEPVYISAGEFTDLHNELLQSRRNSNRGRKAWAGGGFGIKGAIKGSMAAGVMNVSENAVRRSVMAGAARIMENSYKKQLKESPEFINEIIDRWKDFLLEVTRIIINKLCENPAEAMKEFSEVNKFLNNKLINMTEKEAVTALNQNPFDINAYINLYSVNRKYCSELVRLAEFCGIEQEVLKGFVTYVDSKKVCFKPIGIDTDIEQLNKINKELRSLEKNNPAYSKNYNLKFIKEEQEYHKKINECIIKQYGNTIDDYIKKIFESDDPSMDLNAFLNENNKFALDNLFYYLLHDVEKLGTYKYIKKYKKTLNPIIYDALIVMRYETIAYDKYSNCTLKKMLPKH